jgi:hypothetical protein
MTVDSRRFRTGKQAFGRKADTSDRQASRGQDRTEKMLRAGGAARDLRFGSFHVTCLILRKHLKRC